MWQYQRIQDRDYVVNAEYDVEQGSFCISMISLGDLSLWASEESNDEVIQRTKELNTRIAFADADVIPEIIELFNTTEVDVDWSVKRNETDLTLTLTSESDGYRFKFRATLYRSDNNTTKHSQIFTSHLLITIQNLKRVVDQLCEFLRKKDLEISEYKLNEATMTRKNLETPKFDKKVLDELFNQHLPSTASKSSKELFDEFLISYLNQVQLFTRQKLEERQHISEPQKSSVDSLEAPSSVKLTTEVKKKSEEIKLPLVQKAPMKAKQIIKIKTGRVRKLANL